MVANCRITELMVVSSRICSFVLRGVGRGDRSLTHVALNNETATLHAPASGWGAGAASQWVLLGCREVSAKEGG